MRLVRCEVGCSTTGESSEVADILRKCAAACTQWRTGRSSQLGVVD